MSMTFQIGDNVLWAPSIQVGRLFKGQADVIASVFAVPSGVGDVIDDECEIEPAVFVNFVAQLAKQYQGTAHPILRSLLVGFVGTSMVLVERAGLALPDLPPDQRAAWTSLSAEQARSMSR